MERWSFDRSFPKCKYRYARGINGFFYKIGLMELLLSTRFKRSTDEFIHNTDYRRIASYLEIVYQKYRKNTNEARKRFFLRFVKANIETFWDRILKEIILNDRVFVFPRKRLFLFVARYYSPVRKKELIRIMLFASPDMGWNIKPKFIVQPAAQYQKMLDEEIRKGHVYQDIESLMEEILYGYRKKHVQHAIRLSRGRLGDHGKQVQAQEVLNP